MEYLTPKSRCGLCGSEYTRQGLVRHIKSCLTKNIHKTPQAKARKLLYLNIRGAFNPDYFLHLLITANSTLNRLDSFLREIWLECCGHMSAFSLQRYGDEINFRYSVENIFNPGTQIVYQYDFGSTTELIVKAVGYYHGVTDDNADIQIVARNTQPIIPCDECGTKPAVNICSECQWEEKGWLCETCSQTHGCDEEMFLPVVNSPRTGVCGYTGD